MCTLAETPGPIPDTLRKTRVTRDYTEDQSGISVAVLIHLKDC